MTVRTIEDVENDTYAATFGHSEYVGCGTIHCTVIRHKNMNGVRFAMDGKRISKARAEKLVNDWIGYNAKRRAEREATHG
jgi:hypothetical protein